MNVTPDVQRMLQSLFLGCLMALVNLPKLLPTSALSRFPLAEPACLALAGTGMIRYSLDRHYPFNPPTTAYATQERERDKMSVPGPAQAPGALPAETKVGRLGRLAVGAGGAALVLAAVVLADTRIRRR